MLCSAAHPHAPASPVWTLLALALTLLVFRRAGRSRT